MTVTKYTKSITFGFIGLTESSPNIESLSDEIRSSDIVTALDYISVTGDDVDIWFKDELSESDGYTLDDVVAAHTGVVINQPESVTIDSEHTSDNRIRVALEKSNTTTKTLFTSNWCDKTTWYEKSTRVVDEVASDDGYQTTYSLANQSVIDTHHGKITNEDVLTDSDGYSYRATVKVNDTEKTEQDPHYGTGGDYTVDYVNGTVTFLSALDPGDEVKVTYHHASSATFTVKPGAGKKLTIEVVEVQFSKNVEIKDTVLFKVYGYVDVFAPQYTPVPYPSGTLIPIKTVVYKTIMDYQNDSLRSYPEYPALGGSTWRGMTQPLLVFDWDYLRGSVLSSAAGMEIRIEVEHNEEFGGDVATATFYCSSEDE